MANVYCRTFGLLTVAYGLVSGCGDSRNAESDNQVAKTALPQTGERSSSSGEPMGDGASRVPVMVRWGIERSEEAEEVTDFISAEIENTFDEDVTVNVWMRGMGLDQRIAMTALGQYQLRAHETKHVRVAIDDLPLQSVGTPGQIELVGTSSSSMWTNARFPVDAIYVQYAPDFDRAFVSALSTWAPVALALVDGDKGVEEYYELLEDPSMAIRVRAGGVVTDEVDEEKALAMYESVMVPAMRPRGKYLDDSADWVEVLGDEVGGGMLEMTPQLAELMEELEKYVDGGAGSEPSRGVGLVKLCLFWAVEYVDAGYGEDYLNTVGLEAYLATYTRASVKSSDGTFPWSLQPLDAVGCTPVLVLPQGNYSFIINNRILNPGNVGFYTVDDDNWISQWSFPFYVTSSLSLELKLFLGANSNASRVHAVASRVFNTSDPGLTANKAYKLRISDGTCNNYGAYSSVSEICLGYNKPNKQGYHNSQWKNVIAHEIGHSIERDGAGLPPTRYDHAVSEARCTCAHVQEADQRLHCLQSREYAADAMSEGFGHFYAAKLFNSPTDADCYMGYYKDAYGKVFSPIFGPLYPILPPPVTISCRNAARWRVNECNDPYAVAPTGTELDWLTFLWNIHAPTLYGGKLTSMANYYQIKKNACVLAGASTCAQIKGSDNFGYIHFLNAAKAYYGASDQRYQHIVTMGIDHGVKNGPY